MRSLLVVGHAADHLDVSDFLYDQVFELLMADDVTMVDVFILYHCCVYLGTILILGCGLVSRLSIDQTSHAQHIKES